MRGDIFVGKMWRKLKTIKLDKMATTGYEISSWSECSVNRASSSYSAKLLHLPWLPDVLVQLFLQYRRLILLVVTVFSHCYCILYDQSDAIGFDPRLATSVEQWSFVLIINFWIMIRVRGEDPLCCFREQTGSSWGAGGLLWLTSWRAPQLWLGSFNINPQMKPTSRAC